jgi:carbon-monoxide dehydrogenase medium subunit
MKPPQFDYRAPRSIDEALEILAASGEDAAVLAGGQSLMPLLNMRFARPEIVVDINPLTELDYVDMSDSTLTIGATVRLSMIEHHARLAAKLPVLRTATTYVAHPQIRNRTTVGGTLCHADPAAEIPAVAVALGATFQLRSRERGTRRVAAEDFFQSVFLSSKESDELLVSAEFPLRPEFRYRYDEISRRHGDFPFVGLCLGLRVEDGVVTGARAAAAGVADRPLRLTALEEALTGAALSAETAASAAEAAAAEVSPANDGHGTAAFRRGLLRHLVRRLATDQGGNS